MENKGGNFKQAFDIYKNKKVLITGHTGFKGSWLTLWLSELGAQVFGYALNPPTNPSLFELLDLEKAIDHEVGDVRDFNHLKKRIQQVKPDIIFHLAAQSLVGKSYEEPLETIQVNTLGTANLLEAVRQIKTPIALVLITSDKCYENKEWLFGYREEDSLGGRDPYSVSKAATELLIRSWRDSFFHPSSIYSHGIRIASARAGNVIGGGDWSKNRIVPDCIRDLQNHTYITVRNPHSTRPWQHVLEPLSGYLLLGQKLLITPVDEVTPFCEAFNFGPHIANNKSVKELVEKMIEKWGEGSWKFIAPPNANHESSLLSLSIDKAYHKLEWEPKWDFDETIGQTVEWYQKLRQEPSSIRDFTFEQINTHQNKKSMSAQTLLVNETNFNH